MRIGPWLLAVSALLPLSAQDAAALAARENTVKTRAVSGLLSIADAFAAQKQYRRALLLRREVLTEYDENEAKARQQCGFLRVGDSWRRDERVEVLDEDGKGEVKALRKVDQQMDTLARDLTNEHRALAEGWAAAGEADRARKHWARVLRFVPTDKAAVAALSLSVFDGYRGTPAEVDMLRRSRAISGACEWLHRARFPVTSLGDTKHPVLAAAGVAHTGVRSEHFQIFGALPEPQLQKLAEYAERALLLCHTLFGTSTGEAFAPARTRGILFVAGPEQYQKVLDSAASQFDADRLAFLKTLDQAFLDADGASWRLYNVVQGEDVALDVCVRGVVQDAAGVLTNGLWEGLGHAACGFMFHRTLTFLLEQQKERTSASSTSKTLLPDLETWARIAEESAWSKSDTRTSELVLLSAAKFTNEQRVKAWAICDYLFRCRPEFVLELDRSQSPEIRTPPDVEKEFLRRTQYELTRVDAEWRDHWARQSALRAAMAKDPAAAEKPTEAKARLRARSLVDAVNEARAAAMCGPVGFFVADGDEVQVSLRWLDDVQKAEAMQKRKPKEVVPRPPEPPCLGTSTLASKRATAAEAVADWIVQPALRDLLLHPGRSLCGSAIAASNWALDLGPAVATRAGEPLLWPRDGQQGVVGSVRVGDLGPRAVAALTAAGKQPNDMVGVPLTAHFAREVQPGVLAAVQCRVFATNIAAKGVTVVYQATGEADSAAGVVAFVPFDPMAAGPVDVQWEIPATKVGQKEPSMPRLRFTVK